MTAAWAARKARCLKDSKKNAEKSESALTIKQFPEAHLLARVQNGNEL